MYSATCIRIRQYPAIPTHNFVGSATMVLNTTIPNHKADCFVRATDPVSNFSMTGRYQMRVRRNRSKSKQNLLWVFHPLLVRTDSHGLSKSRDSPDGEPLHAGKVANWFR